MTSMGSRERRGGFRGSKSAEDDSDHAEWIGRVRVGGTSSARDRSTHTIRRVDAEGCASQAGPGKFVAAMSHGQTQEICPPKPTENTNFPCWDTGVCAEPVCCGEGCELAGCRDAVWPGKTRISRGTAEGCGAVRAQNNGGILCCRDEIQQAAAPASEDTSAANSASATSASATGVSSESGTESPK